MSRESLVIGLPRRDAAGFSHIVGGVSTGAITTAILVIGGVLGVAYVAAGIVGGIAIDWGESAGADQALWITFLAGGGALLLAGLWALRNASPWLAAGLVSVGAVAGAVAMFWSVLVPLGAILLVVLSVVRARRVTAGTS